MSSPYFGDILGSNSGVIAYANKGAKNFKPSSNEIYGQYTGFKYQCVEYARRWLIQVKSLTFKNVLWATEVWDVSYLRDIQTHERIPLSQHLNGSHIPPCPGNLLIYKRQDKLLWGHIAIITEVSSSKDYVRIAEQNEFDHFWDGNFSRELKLANTEKGFVIEDKYPVLGWMSYSR